MIQELIRGISAWVAEPIRLLRRRGRLTALPTHKEDGVYAT